MSVRVLIDPELLVPGLLTLRGDEHHYLSKVRRLAAGATLVVLDGAGRMASGELRTIGKSASEVWLADPQTVPAPAFRLHLAPALIKGERMDWTISKLVELGVDQITPVETERSVVRLSKERAQSRHKRFASLARAASRQSQNAYPTTIAPVETLQDFLAGPASASLKLIPYLGGPAQPLEQLLPSTPVDSALVLIGPEGGFSSLEAEQALARGFCPVSLGPRTLRAETASIYMASVLGFRYGDVGR